MSRPFERFAVGIETVTESDLSGLRDNRPRLLAPLLFLAAAGTIGTAGWWLQAYLTPQGMLLDAMAGLITVGAGCLLLRHHPDRNLLAGLAGLLVLVSLLSADAGLLEPLLALVLVPLPG
jgi:hypothetical protein